MPRVDPINEIYLEEKILPAKPAKRDASSQLYCPPVAVVVPELGK